VTGTHTKEGRAMATKKCSKCGEVKELEEFHRDRRKPDGRRSRCKPCLNGPRRVRKKSEPATEGEKKCARCGETKHVEEFHRDRSRPDGRNSRCKQCQLDYIRSNRHEPSTEGEKKCTRCGETKHVTEFSPNAANKCGRTSHCKQCKREHFRNNRQEPATEGDKTCARCGETKHVTEFSTCPSGRGGRHNYCNQCNRDYRRGRLREPATGGEKTCIRCGETKHVAEFRPDPTPSDGRGGTCRGCMAARLREFRKTPHGRMASRSTRRRKRFAEGTNSRKPEIKGPARLAAAVLSLEHRREHEPDVDLDTAHDSHITPQFWTIDLHIRAKAVGGDEKTLKRLFCLDGDALNLRPESPTLNVARKDRLAYLPVPGRPDIPVFNLCRDEQATAWALAATRLAVMRAEATGEEFVSPLLDPQGVTYTNGVGFYFTEASVLEEGDDSSAIGG